MLCIYSSGCEFNKEIWISKLNFNLCKVFCTSGPNLVIIDWTGDKLSSRQAWGQWKNTHRQADAGNDSTQRPKLSSGKNDQMIHTCILCHKELDWTHLKSQSADLFRWLKKACNVWAILNHESKTKCEIIANLFWNQPTRNQPNL